MSRWWSSESATAVVLAATIVCACLIGTNARVSVDEVVVGSRNQVIDVLVTGSNTDPVTMVDGVANLAPDAWMTPGSITPEQIDVLAALPQVEVAAPLAVLPFYRPALSQTGAVWFPHDPDENLAWVAQIRATVEDGTGVRSLQPRTLAHQLIDGDMSATAGFHTISAYPAPWIGRYMWFADGRYYEHSQEVFGLWADFPLIPARSFSIGVDPLAEAALAQAGGASDLAHVASDLAVRTQQHEELTEDTWSRTYGKPVPAMVASFGDLPDITVSADISVKEPQPLPSDAIDSRAGSCPAHRDGDWDPRRITPCGYLSDSGIEALKQARTISHTTVSTRSPSAAWFTPAHPISIASGPLPLMYWDAMPGYENTQRSVPVPLSRQGTGQARVSVLPVAPPMAYGDNWHDESYRGVTDAGLAIPDLGLVASIENTYRPTQGVFLPGSSPFEASTLRTDKGRILQSFQGVGAASSPASAVVDLKSVWALLSPGVPGSTSAGSTASAGGSKTAPTLGANVVRLRLTRPAPGQAASEESIAQVVREVSRMGLVATVLNGASPVEMTVDLGGADAIAWHGQATETWAELGADVRVEGAAGWVVAVLPVLAVFCVAGLVVLTERTASRRRIAAGRLLAGCGWSGSCIRSRLLGQVIPGVLLVLAACATGGALSLARGGSGVNVAVVLAAGGVYVVGVLGLALLDARRALQPAQVRVQERA